MTTAEDKAAIRQAIDAAKQKYEGDPKALRRAIRTIIEDDCHPTRIDKSEYGRPGSRSPSFGKWNRDDAPMRAQP